MKDMNNINGVIVNGEVYVLKSSIEDFEKRKHLIPFYRLNFEGEYCIVRSATAGVFAGYIARKDGQEVGLANARRLWYWSGANSLSDIANFGVTQPALCKFPAAVSIMIVMDVIEILKCTEAGRASIMDVPIWDVRK